MTAHAPTSPPPALAAPTTGRTTTRNERRVTHVLRAGTLLVRRGPGDIQIGLDPRWCIRFTGLTPTEEHQLTTLQFSAPVRIGAASPPLLLALVDAGFLIPRRRRGQAAIHAPAGGRADIPALGILLPDGAAHHTLENRADAVVALSGLGRLGIATATILATAGIGRFVLDDTTPVEPTDTGLGHYRWGDIGAHREVAAQRILCETSPSALVDNSATPDVVVATEHLVADPDRYRTLMGDGVPHLPVVAREASVFVGPYVDPGRTPCLTCADLHRADEDPAWPAIAKQLQAMRHRRRKTDTEETVLAITAAAVTANQVLCAVDGLAPRTASGCIEIHLPDAIPRMREFGPHPDCGCHDLA